MTLWYEYKLFFFLWVRCCLLGRPFRRDLFSMWYICILIRTYVDLTFFFVRGIRSVSLNVRTICCLCLFSLWLIFRSRVIGACLVTTDCIVRVSSCVNNSNSNNQRTTNCEFYQCMRQYRIAHIRRVPLRPK